MPTRRWYRSTTACAFDGMFSFTLMQVRLLPFARGQQELLRHMLDDAGYAAAQAEAAMRLPEVVKALVRHDEQGEARHDALAARRGRARKAEATVESMLAEYRGQRRFCEACGRQDVFAACPTNMHVRTSIHVSTHVYPQACGTKMAPDDRGCLTCGRGALELASCATCGVAIAPSALHCTSCGAVHDGSATADDIAEPVGPFSATPPAWRTLSAMAADDGDGSAAVEDEELQCNECGVGLGSVDRWECDSCVRYTICATCLASDPHRAFSDHQLMRRPRPQPTAKADRACRRPWPTLDAEREASAILGRHIEVPRTEGGEPHIGTELVALATYAERGYFFLHKYLGTHRRRMSTACADLKERNDGIVDWRHISPKWGLLGTGICKGPLDSRP